MADSQQWLNQDYARSWRPPNPCGSYSPQLQYTSGQPSSDLSDISSQSQRPPALVNPLQTSGQYMMYPAAVGNSFNPVPAPLHVLPPQPAGAPSPYLWYYPPPPVRLPTSCYEYSLVPPTNVPPPFPHAGFHPRSAVTNLSSLAQRLNENLQNLNSTIASIPKQYDSYPTSTTSNPRVEVTQRRLPVIDQGGSSDNQGDSEGNLCVVCMNKPQTSGFVHKKQSHRCVCEECAELIYASRRTCPICRQYVESIILKYY